MCGVGLIFSRDKSSAERVQIAEKMHRSIEHRGPDGSGVWSESEGLSIFHRRLAIVDLSPAGHQPMVSESGRWIISFNGEIYNHQDLRHSLAGKNLKWKGSSDTEVLLHLIETYGPAAAIASCDGMFAIILWDRQEQQLYLIRDRIGEKPLYYGRVSQDFVVGSELKVFHSHPGFRPEINPEALAAFLKYSYVPTPLSIFKNIYKVNPAHIYQFSLDNLDNPKTQKFWSLPRYDEEIPPKDVSYEETKQQVEDLLLGAVRREMQADVPLGVFLSGGVDSSLICALMARLNSGRVDSFTIGFDDKNYDESHHAREVARHLGTRHTEWIVSGKDCLNAIEKIPSIYDEPFADSSQVPTFLLSKMTRQNVTVALSGDGGDELFAGYNRYRWTRSVWSKTRWVPPFLRPVMAGLGTNVNTGQWDSLYANLNKISKSSKKIENFGTKMTKGLDLFKATSLKDLHDRILSHWFNPGRIILGHPNYTLEGEGDIGSSDFEHYMMWHDQLHYLPDDIMVKVDRASMANSLETRAPFLDHNLIDYVTAAPFDWVRDTNAPKKMIRDILLEYVPRELIERPKQGFGIPIYDWFKTELRDMTLDLTDEAFLRKQGLFDAKFVSEFARSQLNQNLSQPYHLWDLLMFQLWHSKWMP